MPANSYWTDLLARIQRPRVDPAAAIDAPPALPPGYRPDAQGRLVPESMIPTHELARDHMVRDLVTRCREASDLLSALKADLLRDVADHVASVAADYGVSTEGRAGGVVLESYDGLLRVERVMSERTTVGEGIHAAEQLVREYLADARERLGDDAAGLVAIADRSFRRNRKTGELNPARVLDLVNVDIDDDRWRQAQKAVRESLQPAGSVTYFRAYTRTRPDEAWQQVPLDFSAVTPAGQGAA
jgi:hypothetical protein